MTINKKKKVNKTKEKKENKQIVEVHIYVHHNTQTYQAPSYGRSGGAGTSPWPFYTVTN